MLYRLVVVLAVAACGEALPRNSLIADSNGTSSELRGACAFTEQKCTRCHTIGRVLAWDATTREQWEPVVTRMRQMASSGISKEDAEVVLDCLAQRNGSAPAALRMKSR
jgi:hypothetical protein